MTEFMGRLIVARGRLVPKITLVAIWELLDLEVFAQRGLDAWLRHVMPLLRRELHADGATLFLGCDGEFRLAAFEGCEAEPTWTVHTGKGIAGSVVGEGRAKIVNDPAALGFAASGRYRSAMVVPVIGRTEPIGVLNLSRRTGQCFAATDLETAQLLARQLALAVENVRLLEQRDRFAERDHLARVGEMTATIAHEIRNPLTGIRGAAQLWQSAPELAGELGDQIVREVDRLSELCEDFLSFARPVRLSLGAAAMHEFLECLARELQAEMKLHDAELRLSAEPTWVNFDPSRLRQVLLNLCQNAAQAEATEIIIRATKDGIAVSDNGKGMDATTMEKLFQPFFTTRPQGTGLGLAHTKRLVEAHGWSLSVLSELGKGTTMHINFPAEAKAA